MKAQEFYTQDQMLRVDALMLAVHTGEKLFSEKDLTPEEISEVTVARAKLFYEFISAQTT